MFMKGRIGKEKFDLQDLSWKYMISWNVAASVARSSIQLWSLEGQYGDASI